jgi:hypothetical protein
MAEQYIRDVIGHSRCQLFTLSYQSVSWYKLWLRLSKGPISTEQLFCFLFVISRLSEKAFTSACANVLFGIYCLTEMVTNKSDESSAYLKRKFEGRVSEKKKQERQSGEH